MLASETPPIELTSMNVINSRVKESNRRRQLQENTSTLIVELEVEGEFISDENHSEATDVPYDQIVKGYFTEDSSRSVLVNDIKQGSESSADSFSEIGQVEVQSDTTVFTGATSDPNQGLSKQNLIIIASAVSAGAAVLLLAMLVFLRRRRYVSIFMEKVSFVNKFLTYVSFRRSNISSPEPNQFNEVQDDESVDVYDMFKKTYKNDNKEEKKEETTEPSLFPDVALHSTNEAETQKNDQTESNENEFQSVIPSNVFSEKNEPESRYEFSNRKQEEKKEWTPSFEMHKQTTQKSNNLASTESEKRDDDEKSQDTFYTLDRIYSGEGDNESYHTYDNYSLDDGIATTASNDADDATLSVVSGPMKMNLYNLSRYDSDDDETVGVSVGENSTVVSGLTLDAKPADDEVVKTIQAPPGKLSIVIDTAKYGPIVHEVKAESPLQGMIIKGDRIIAIDDIDTTRLSATKVTNIVAEKCDMQRKFTIARKVGTNDYF